MSNMSVYRHVGGLLLICWYFIDMSICRCVDMSICLLICRYFIDMSIWRYVDMWISNILTCRYVGGMVARCGGGVQHARPLQGSAD